VVTALRELLSDPDFVQALRNEALDELPKYLADQVQAKGGAA